MFATLLLKKNQTIMHTTATKIKRCQLLEKYYTYTIIFMAVCMLKVPIPRRYLVCYQKMLSRMFIHECETVSNNKKKVNETTLINVGK